MEAVDSPLLAVAEYISACSDGRTEIGRLVSGRGGQMEGKDRDGSPLLHNSREQNQQQGGLLSWPALLSGGN